MLPARPRLFYCKPRLLQGGAGLILIGLGANLPSQAGMPAETLRAAIATDMGIPTLSHWFESSVPGLYFVGLTSLRAFGPLYRFVVGCKATATRVASSAARKRAIQNVA